MASAYWDEVRASGLRVPPDRPLDDLTAELTAMLGSTDPGRRDRTAYEVLAGWISRGVYDDLLPGLGDGMAAGLERGLGEVGTDSVFRRSYSALVLTECIERDNRTGALTADRILTWGDRLAGWFLGERDLRGFVPGKGWAHALAHGSDAIGAIADSPHLDLAELTVLLDVLGERVVLPTGMVIEAGEPDRLAAATLRILRRDLVPLELFEPWTQRIAEAATPAYDDENPYPLTLLPQAFLRALHLQLSLGSRRPKDRADQLLVLVDALRLSNPAHLSPRKH
ncbi:DUF2785 domain-containing protein [Nocardioides daejeonensis]|uniref:DUF2785 domain-containing protein n=1 Tax=Nocardioides daejeonensis TaxID=1046556 RepID=UPI000D74C7E6|nr:DUF2785 domain-containing protein [Nocardioides daejeonensis]